MARAFLLMLVAILLMAPVAQADDNGGFGPFVKDELSVPKSVAKIRDPTGGAPTSTVYSFRLPSGYCNPKPYAAGSPESDCTYNSSRSQMRENKFTQPAQSWYGWSVYFPADFVYGDRQARGHYMFAYWHNHQCPHLGFSNGRGADNDGNLYLETSRSFGNYECAENDVIKVASFRDLVGKWNRFEMFVKWANDGSGRAQVYLDGELKVDYSGPTLTKGLENINYFKFGLYLCCTKDVARIKGTQLYFANVRSARTREGLAAR